MPSASWRVSPSYVQPESKASESNSSHTPNDCGVLLRLGLDILEIVLNPKCLRRHGAYLLLMFSRNLDLLNPTQAIPPTIAVYCSASVSTYWRLCSIPNAFGVMARISFLCSAGICSGRRNDNTPLTNLGRQKLLASLFSPVSSG